MEVELWGMIGLRLWIYRDIGRDGSNSIYLEVADVGLNVRLIFYTVPKEVVHFQ